VKNFMLLKAWLKQNKPFFTSRDYNFLATTLLATKSPDAISPGRLEEIKALYGQHMPMAYILGKEEFYGLEFDVDRRVLIPRPETELLVEKSLALIKIHDFKSVLDIGCGSGAIAVAIKKFSDSNIHVSACDISPVALEVAKSNALKHQVEINFFQSDLFASFAGQRFDLIVSNPPYVAIEDKTVQLSFEPDNALYAKDNGLAIIKRILQDTPNYLIDGGYLLMEFGYDQRVRLQEEVVKIGEYENVIWVKDYQGHDRLVCLCRKKQYNA
jgi:release factor glutamine methyltransferase